MNAMYAIDIIRINGERIRIRQPNYNKIQIEESEAEFVFGCFA